MGYHSVMQAQLDAPSKEVLEKVILRAEQEQLFEDIEMLGEIRVLFYGTGKYYDEWMVPFYEYCAALGCFGSFDRTGEEFGDIERVNIMPGKVERRWARFPDESDVTLEVPVANQVVEAKEERKWKTSTSSTWTPATNEFTAAAPLSRRS